MEKQAVLEQLSAGFGSVLKAIDGVDDRGMTTVFYGTWSIKDILAHLSGWHHQMTGAMERMARGEKPTPEGVDYSDSDGWNARFAAAMRPQNATTVVADLKQSFANYRRAAEAIPADRFGEGKTINRLIDGSGTGHYAEHLPAILDYKSRINPGVANK